MTSSLDGRPVTAALPGASPAPLGAPPASSAAPLGAAPAPLGTRPAPLGAALAPLGTAPALLGTPPASPGTAPALLGTPPASPGTVTVLPVTDNDRAIGAWIVGPDTATFRPVVDVNRLAGAVLATAGAVAIAVFIATAGIRRRPAIGAVTMGPGGWVSVKRTGCPPLRSTEHRPWWARLLGAHRLTSG